MMPFQCPSPEQGFRFFSSQNVLKGEIINLDTHICGPVSQCLCPSDKIQMGIPLDESQFCSKDLAKLALAHLYGTQIAAVLADNFATVIENSMNNNGSSFSSLRIHEWAVSAWQDLQNENAPAPR